MISASEVKRLREITGAGMMDCKNALTEAAGDADLAIEILRKQGQKLAAKRADRTTNEGVVAARKNGNKAILVGVGCETDFVAKNEGFQEFVNKIADVAIQNVPATREELLALSFEDGTVEDALVLQTGKIGEKIDITDYVAVEGDNLATYIHAGSKIGVVVNYKDGGKEGADQFFKGIAMHIAAMSPSILSPEEFDPIYIAKETEAFQNQIKVENEERARLGKHLKNVPKYASISQLTPDVMAQVKLDIEAELKAEGKPEKIWDKIFPGKLERFITDNTLLDQEHCLLSQVYALDDSKNVKQAITEFSTEAQVLSFKRVSIGK
jgi:elongation factor Ts